MASKYTTLEEVVNNANERERAEATAELAKNEQKLAKNEQKLVDLYTEVFKDNIYKLIPAYERGEPYFSRLIYAAYVCSFIYLGIMLLVSQLSSAVTFTSATFLFPGLACFAAVATKGLFKIGTYFAARLGLLSWHYPENIQHLFNAKNRSEWGERKQAAHNDISTVYKGKEHFWGVRKNEVFWVSGLSGITVISALFGIGYLAGEASLGAVIGCAQIFLAVLTLKLTANLIFYFFDNNDDNAKIPPPQDGVNSSSEILHTPSQSGQEENPSTFFPSRDTSNESTLESPPIDDNNSSPSPPLR